MSYIEDVKGSDNLKHIDYVILDYIYSQEEKKTSPSKIKDEVRFYHNYTDSQYSYSIKKLRDMGHVQWTGIHYYLTTSGVEIAEDFHSKHNEWRFSEEYVDEVESSSVRDSKNMIKEMKKDLTKIAKKLEVLLKPKKVGAYDNTTMNKIQSIRSHLFGIESEIRAIKEELDEN